MIIAAIDQLEKDLAIHLPADFRGALADPPVHEALRRDMLDTNPTLWGDDSLLDTISALRNRTQECRRILTWIRWKDQEPTDQLSEAHEEKPWPHHWLSLGENFCGDVYLLDLSREPAPIALWSHESLTCHVEWPSVAEWADAVRRHGEECLQNKPPPIPRNASCPKCGAELTAMRARMCRGCGARW